jgi:hypothetical protein
MLDNDDKKWFDRRFESMEQRMDRMVEGMEAMETRLLTEFHRWAQTYEISAGNDASRLRFRGSSGRN